MRKVFFHLFGMPIPAYALFSLVALVLCALIILSEAKRKGWDRRSILWLTAWSYAIGFVGAHFFYMMMRLGDMPWGLWFSKLLRISGSGYVWHAGLAAATVFVVTYARRKRIPLLSMLDSAALVLPVALGTGRIGCFFAGCCGGIGTDSVLGLQFPRNPPGVLVHPTQLYDMAFQYAVFGLLWHWRTRKPDGHILAWYLILVPAGRIVLEIFRAPMGRDMLGEWFSVDQLIAIGMIAIGIGLLSWLRRRSAA